jgi:hypothetical protein
MAAPSPRFDLESLKFCAPCHAHRNNSYLSVNPSIYLRPGREKQIRGESPAGLPPRKKFL